MSQSYKSPETLEKTPTYMKELTRTECTGIFAIRSRMVKTKSNYKTQYNDQKCRWCTTELETQNHIMTKCPQFKDLTKHINYNKIMENDSECENVKQHDNLRYWRPTFAQHQQTDNRRVARYSEVFPLVHLCRCSWIGPLRVDVVSNYH